MTKGLVFNVQRFSLHDGPGIRTTVFFKGCPLSCRWCHNPEGIDAAPQLAADAVKCIGCGACIAVCPAAALALNEQGRVEVDFGRCTLCRKCAAVCPTETLEVIGREVAVNELKAELLKDRIVFEESGGGVTVSGGEPFGQPEFLVALLKELKEENVHTAVDTSGCAPWEAIEEAAGWTDLFLYDLKLVDSAESAGYTGGSGEEIRRNLPELIARGYDVLVRVPVIPTVNDSREHLALLGEFLRESGAVDVELLAYHRLGVAKRFKLGQNFLLPDIAEPPESAMQAAVDFLKQYGLNILYKADDDSGAKRHERAGPEFKGAE